VSVLRYDKSPESQLGSQMQAMGGGGSGTSQVLPSEQVQVMTPQKQRRVQVTDASARGAVRATAVSTAAARNRSFFVMAFPS
jgi:hypothetical protein